MHACMLACLALLRAHPRSSACVHECVCPCCWECVVAPFGLIVPCGGLLQSRSSRPPFTSAWLQWWQLAAALPPYKLCHLHTCIAMGWRRPTCGAVSIITRILLKFPDVSYRHAILHHGSCRQSPHHASPSCGRAPSLVASSSSSSLLIKVPAAAVCRMRGQSRRTYTTWSRTCHAATIALCSFS